MNAKTTVIFLDEGNDVEDVWTEVARGSTREELLRQLREHFWKDEQSIDDEESTGPPTFKIHFEGEPEDEDLILFNATLEDVAKTAVGEIETDTTTSEREDRKEIEEILREARKHTPSDETEPNILKVA